MDYDDIIDLPHYEPKYHHRMPVAKRAAQFAPFAALSGFSEMIKETERAVERSFEEPPPRTEDDYYFGF